MAPVLTEDVQGTINRVIAQYGLGSVLSVAQEGSGVIHKTYRVDTAQGSFICQQLNTSIFGSGLYALEFNYERYVSAFSATPELKGEWIVPAWQKATSGGYFFSDTDGSSWRVYGYIEGKTLPAVGEKSHLEQYAIGLSKIHFVLKHFEGQPQPAIPQFHDLPFYYDEYMKALGTQVPRKENCHCVKTISDGISLALSVRTDINPCTIHGDPKTGNVILNDKGKAIAFIDLDTFMYASKLLDIADSVRSIANTAGEAPEDDSRVAFDKDSCEVFLHSYYTAPTYGLSKREESELASVLLMIPFELGLRFYTDYLRGDTYFAVDYQEQNLHRAMCQFRLFEDMRRKGLQGIVNKAFRR
ncbi:MAG: aminoglycoside phosphotransferase family protein [Coriobacteriia bacterium]|nr:aminoglycoside phosphotransferase family protein [Coriobacteriia bacterium]